MILSGRRVAARSGARARHVQGDRAAARPVCRAGRREGRRADHRRPRHRRDRRRSARARRVDDLGRRASTISTSGIEGAGQAEALHGPADRAVRAARHAPLGPVGDDAQLARGSRARCTASSARRPTRGSASCGRAAARGRTACRTATLADNFCNRWSGGLNFLRHAYNGSEVSVEPDGAVYPCCIKTKLPIGSLLEDNLIDILDSLAGVPAYEAITMGHPERMGLAHGWSEEEFIAASRTTTPNGTPYQNLCIGCDRFHERGAGPGARGSATRAGRPRRGIAAPSTAAQRPIVADRRLSHRDDVAMRFRLAAARACARDAARRRRARSARLERRSSPRRAARPSTSTRGPATRRPTRSSPGWASEVEQALRRQASITSS